MRGAVVAAGAAADTAPVSLPKDVVGRIMNGDLKPGMRSPLPVEIVKIVPKFSGNQKRYQLYLADADVLGQMMLVDKDLTAEIDAGNVTVHNTIDLRNWEIQVLASGKGIPVLSEASVFGYLPPELHNRPLQRCGPPGAVGATQSQYTQEPLVTPQKERSVAVEGVTPMPCVRGGHGHGMPSHGAPLVNSACGEPNSGWNSTSVVASSSARPAAAVPEARSNDIGSTQPASLPSRHVAATAAPTGVHCDSVGGGGLFAVPTLVGERGVGAAAEPRAAGSGSPYGPTTTASTGTFALAGPHATTQYSVGAMAGPQGQVELQRNPYRSAGAARGAVDSSGASFGGDATGDFGSGGGGGGGGGSGGIASMLGVRTMPGGTETTLSSRGGSVARPQGGAVIPIGELSPYQHRWRIKARVTMKGEVRKFANARGEGQFFKIELVDKYGSCIQATFFGRGCETFCNRIFENRVYFFSSGAVKAANRRFDRGEFVITFDEKSNIEEADDDHEITSGTRYACVPLAQAVSSPIGTTLDVRGVISEAREPQIITTRATNEERLKRDIVIWDNSGPEGSTHIEVSLWGDRARQECQPEDVFFARDCRVGEWNGQKSLNASVYETNPDREESATLLRLWSEAGKPGFCSTVVAGRSFASSATSTGGLKTISEIHNEDINLGPPPAAGQPLPQGGPLSVHRHSAQGVILAVQNDERPPYYPACPCQVEQTSMTQGAGARTRLCHKKMTQEGSNWRCANGHTATEPTHRYLLRMSIADATGDMELSAFDEVGVKLFGCPADDIAKLSREELLAKMSKPRCQRIACTIRSMRERFQDEERIKCVALDIKPVSLADEARRMLTHIHEAIGVF